MNKSRCCENREAYGLAVSGVVAALYIVLTLAFAPLVFWTSSVSAVGRLELFGFI